MKHITLGLPPEILDALQHLGGRNETEIHKIVCEALRKDFQRRARLIKPPAKRAEAA